MRKIFNIYSLTSFLLVSVFVYGQTIEHGIPFFRNISANEYNANSQNFDIYCDDYGTIYAANFDGLLYFDGATWRTIYTPGISRVTRVEKGPDGHIWIAGFNVLGYLVADDHGNLKIKTLMSDENNKNQIEFDGLKTYSGQLYAHTSMGSVYRIDKGNKLVEIPQAPGNIFRANDTKDYSKCKLSDGVVVEYTKADGIRFLFPNGSFTDLSEANGLVSNTIYDISYNHVNTLWGATSNGLFFAEVTTPYSKISETEGLKGEVYAINQIGNTIYIGTQNGLYALHDGNIKAIPQIDLACWDLVKDNKGRLIAPTSNGLFIISDNGIKKISGENSVSVCIDTNTQELIVGEIGGVFRVNESGKHEQISKLEKVMYMMFTGDKILARTIYGSEWELSANPKVKFADKCINGQPNENEYEVDYTDCFGRRWVTDGEGYNLKIESKNKADQRYTLWTYPLTKLCVEAVYVCKDGTIFAGGEFGVIVISSAVADKINVGKIEKPYIRTVVANDSILWGGYSPDSLKPLTDIEDIDIPRDNRDITVTFSSRINSLVNPTKYRYRLNEGTWSNWSTDPYVTFKNAEYGHGKLEVQMMDTFGRQSDVSIVKWYVHYPFYMQWWAFIFYIIILIGLVSLFFMWRTKRLHQEKIKLEGIVTERTSELRDALDDLKRTQSDLVRMERTATAGKLTQGLIDRILNPINYINNFSKLTSNLAKDLHEDIEDEKENMSEDNYDDCEDILGMMDSNLEKIQEHGVNTTRTLRAMEAMLNTHIGELREQDIVPLCSQAMKVSHEYHKDAIERCQIKLTEVYPSEPVMANIDADAINRILVSMLTNSIYAIVKKYDKCPYNAEMKIIVEVGENIVLTIFDNGIGMQESVKDKVFDPFFTTKPTGVAAGVGLYLVRELVHDHNAEISLSSELGEYCEFKITFPKIQ